MRCKLLVTGNYQQLTGATQMLKSSQVRAELRIGRDKLRELIQAGELEAIRTGDAPNSPYRITEESLDAYKERHRVEPVAAVG
jgi:excisionase family DNA binding protein